MPRMRSGAIFRAFRCGEAPRMRGGGAAFRTVSGRFSGCGCMPCVGRLSCEVSGPVGGGGSSLRSLEMQYATKRKRGVRAPLFLLLSPAFWGDPCFLVASSFWVVSSFFAPPRGGRLSAFGDAARRRGADGRCGVAGLQLLDVAGRAVARAARRGAVRLA